MLEGGSGSGCRTSDGPSLLLLGRDLETIGGDKVGGEAVRHLAVLQDSGGKRALLVAADNSGESLWVDLSRIGC